MPGKDDGADWTFESADTNLEEITPVPEAVPAPLAETTPSTATTGSYRTLSGFEKAAAKEISGARDRLYGRDEVFMAYKLRLMEKRMHPDAAEEAMQDFRRWLSRPGNEELVQVALREPKAPLSRG